MKFVKKLTALFLAVCMVMAMGITAFAGDTTYTISTKTGDTHTYSVYQIFTGTLSTDGVTLSDVKAGKNFKTENEAGAGKTNLAADEAAKALSDWYKSDPDATNAEKLAQITKYLDETKDAYAEVTESSPKSDVPAGYYLVRDEDNTITGDDSYTTYIVEVAGNVKIERKASKPTVDKDVADEVNEGSHPGDSNKTWGKTADHEIGESFQFKLTAKIDADKDYADYDKYEITFRDTMSNGVTYESIASVKINGTDITNYTTDFKAWGEDATASETHDGDSEKVWTLTIADVKSYGVDITTAGATIEVIYNAHLNSSAKVNTASGSTTNENKVDLKYSNNPNADGSGDRGTTPEHKVWVFTYGLLNTKYKGSVVAGNELADAGFKLYTDADCKNEYALVYDETLAAYRPAVASETGVEMKSAETTGKFNVSGIDVGTYYLKETTTPNGYNTVPVTKIEIKATHSTDKDVTTPDVDLSSSSNMSNDLIDMPGSALPETGGMGTTVIYIAGIALIVAAGVVVIARKRMA